MITAIKSGAKDFQNPEPGLIGPIGGDRGFPKTPEPFLTLRVHDLTDEPSITGLCVGYERSEWRASQFVDHLMEWLPEFALNHTELAGMHSGNMVKMIRHAARKVYESKKFKVRGEFGELFLHAAILCESIAPIIRIDRFTVDITLRVMGSKPTIR